MATEKLKITFVYWTNLDVPFAGYYVESGELIKDGKVVLRRGMNISDEEIIAAGLEVPYTPSFEKWKTDIAAKRRCGACHDALRGPADLEHHIANNLRCRLWVETQRAGKNQYQI